MEIHFARGIEQVGHVMDVSLLNVTPFKMVMSSTDQIFLLAVIKCMTSPRQTGLEIDKLISFPPQRNTSLALNDKDCVVN
jgi:hypothetical protein